MSEYYFEGKLCSADELKAIARHRADRIEELQAENERLTAEVSRLTMMLDEYVRLDNAGLIPMRPVAAADKENDPSDRS